MEWEQELIQAVHDDASRAQEIFRPLRTRHANTPPQAIKDRAIRLIRTALNGNAPALYRTSIALTDSGDETCEEIGLILLADHYLAHPDEVTERMYRSASSDSWEVREWAASACGIVLCNHFAEFQPILMKWTQDESANRRRCAAAAVKYASKHKKQEHYEGLVQIIQPLLSDQDSYVQKNLGPFAIGDGLLKHYPEQAVHLLRDWSGTDDEYVRRNLALVFTSAAGARYYDRLSAVFRLLQEDDRAAVQSAVKQAEANLRRRIPDWPREGNG